MNFYTDKNGLIVQRDLDGGDTTGREGDYWFYEGLEGGKFVHLRSKSFEEVLQLLQVKPGVFIRNPINYNDPKDFSRDQTVPLILAMGERNKHDLLKLLLKKQLKNWFRYQNGDLGLIGDAGYYIRALKAWYAYPLLLIGDFQILINSIIRVIAGFNRDNVSDDINHTLILLQAKNHYPTPISWLARKIYKLVPGGIQNRWDHYFRPETGANAFNDLYRNEISDM